METKKNSNSNYLNICSFKDSGRKYKNHVVFMHDRE